MANLRPAIWLLAVAATLSAVQNARENSRGRQGSRSTAQASGVDLIKVHNNTPRDFGPKRVGPSWKCWRVEGIAAQR
jgi:hypothetical protein